ncbi:patatin-like phospholipase family protein [Streptomyces sp. MBT33]|uniref:patatin-like phospholipase family protein n=1 Tax=Streptomyces sp. MBT33 TaxID=1488363 RepID=UPI00190CE0F0|nr:patatin-like phospholipase family protein [Streptomyces sp. MBT33]MBK3644763.1 patatin-like phospholipase family protein [Streptomyces sp. MBT33]
MALVAGLLSFAGAGLTAWHAADVRSPLQAELNGAGALAWQVTQGGGIGSPGGWWLRVAGTLLLGLGAVLGWLVSLTDGARRVFGAAALTLLGITVLHEVEHLLLRLADSRCDLRYCPVDLSGLSVAVQATAFLVYTLLPPAGVVAVVGACVTLNRLYREWRFQETTYTRPPKQGKDVRPREAGAFTSGSDDYWRSNATVPRGRKISDSGLGISLSGGGMRSAAFSLGALTALREARGRDGSELTKADYLSAVSGGGYIAGAFLLALHQEKKDTPGATPDDVFDPGSPEFDYLRKNASYLGRNTREWAAAFATVIRGALLSTVVLALITYVAGRWVGHFYHRAQRRPVLIHPGAPAWGLVLPTAAMAAVALLCWLVAAHRRGGSSRRAGNTRLSHVAFVTGCATALLVTAGAVVPAVAWASEQLADWGPTTTTATAYRAFFGGSAVGTLGLALGILGFWSEHKAQLKSALKQAEGAVRWFTQLGDFGRRILQSLAVYGGLALVAAAYLLFFGAVVSDIAGTDPRKKPHITWGTPDFTLPVTNFEVTVILTGFLVLGYLLLDETSLGLHSFYRERLSRAFAVRRRHDPKTTAARHLRTVCWKAEGYPIEEATWSCLERYGRSPSGPHGSRFPQVIFCAAAHSSDPSDVELGRQALPFTFSYDCMGGPRTEWIPVRTARAALHAARCDRLCGDLTVATAMAVSGAAFSSAMGRYSQPAEVLLALTNARLGTWVVNPNYLNHQQPRWFDPPIPARRRMSYLMREVFGCYSRKLPLMFVTDGAHYEYLGLVELFRHRCTEIYCFDASTDRRSFAASIAETITLAHAELGVEVTLDTPDEAAPHGASPNGGPATDEESLRARLADTPVLTGTFRYRDGVKGILVIGKATLDPNTPWEVRRYAAEHRLFPYDSVGDQFFDAAKFDAYTTLGRHVGRRAAEAMHVQRLHRDMPGLQPYALHFGARGRR